MIVSTHEICCMVLLLVGRVHIEDEPLTRQMLCTHNLFFPLRSFFETFWFCERNQNNKYRIEIETILICMVHMYIWLFTRTITAPIWNGALAFFFPFQICTYRYTDTHTLCLPCWEPRENWIVPLSFIFFVFILIVFFLSESHQSAQAGFYIFKCYKKTHEANKAFS